MHYQLNVGEIVSCFSSEPVQSQQPVRELLSKRGSSYSAPLYPRNLISSRESQKWQVWYDMPRRCSSSSHQRDGGHALLPQSLPGFWEWLVCCNGSVCAAIRFALHEIEKARPARQSRKVSVQLSGSWTSHRLQEIAFLKVLTPPAVQPKQI